MNQKTELKLKNINGNNKKVRRKKDKRPQKCTATPNVVHATHLRNRRQRQVADTRTKIDVPV